jgi:hypothetical protein
MLLPSAGDEQLVRDVSEIAAARAHGPNDGPTPALPLVAGGSTA